MKNIFWSGYCNGARIEAISTLQRVIHDFGYITDFKIFSDVAISMRIEIEELNIDRLYEALTGYLNITGFDKITSASKSERVIFLHITFTKGTGDVKLEVPAVPG
jgi:hypothetical protein